MAYDEALAERIRAALRGRDGVRVMDFGHRPMKGMIYVGPAGVATDPELTRWVDAGAEFAESLPPK